MTSIEERVAVLERRAELLEQRALQLEGASVWRRPEPEPAIEPEPAPAAEPAPSWRPVAPPRRARAERRDLEDLLGGRVLGWLGAAALLVGLLFLLVMAASRGWLGEEARVLMAGAVSVALFGAGAWLHERRGRLEVALAAAASGSAGLFATLVVAGPVYGLLPAPAALAAALVTGAATTLLALRWRAQGIAWLGLLGAVASPLLVGADGGAAMSLMLAAYVATAAIGLWQRWHAIAMAAFVLAAGQLGLWIAGPEWAGGGDPAGALAALVVLGAATAVAAVGFEWRARAERLRPSAVVLLALNALVLAGLGAMAAPSATAWLAALAGAHLAAGLVDPPVAARHAASSRWSRSRSASCSATSPSHSWPTACRWCSGWAAGSAGFAALARAARHRGDEIAVLSGLGGHLLLAIGTAFTGVAPVEAVGGTTDAATLAALAGLAVSAWAAARLLPDRLADGRLALDGLAVTLLVLWTAVALEGAALTIALAGEAAALALVARRTRDEMAGPLGLGVLAVALGHGIVVLAPPEALASGLPAVVPALSGLGAVIAAALVAARGAATPALRTALVASAGLVALHLASALLLTPFEPAEQGQPLVSALWAAAGLALVVAGLVRDARELRLAGLALLGAAAAKVFLADLASLDALYRVGSFLALGLLLMLGGFAWQRLRPAPLGDVRHQYP